MLAADDGRQVADALIRAVGQVVRHDGTCLLAFHRDSPPQVLHHTLEPEGERHYVERYLAIAFTRVSITGSTASARIYATRWTSSSTWAMAAR